MCMRASRIDIGRVGATRSRPTRPRPTSPTDRSRHSRDVTVDRVAELERALLVELHEGDRGDRLGHRVDAPDGVLFDRLRPLPVHEPEGPAVGDCLPPGHGDLATRRSCRRTRSVGSKCSVIRSRRVLVHSGRRRVDLHPRRPNMLALGAALATRSGDHVAQLGRVPPAALVGRRARHPSLGHADVAAGHVEHPTGDAWPTRAAQPHHQRGDVVGIVGVELVGLPLRAGSPKPRFSVIRVSAAGAMALTVTP